MVTEDNTVYRKGADTTSHYRQQCAINVKGIHPKELRDTISGARRNDGHLRLCGPIPFSMCKEAIRCLMEHAVASNKDDDIARAQSQLLYQLPSVVRMGCHHHLTRYARSLKREQFFGTTREGLALAIAFA